MNAAIRIDRMSRSFGQVKALDDLSLEVPSGIIFGFLGPNGSGKTTTIHLLLGLLEPTEGSAEVLGFDTRTQGQEIRSRAGALLEHNGLYEQMSAEDNLEFYGRAWRLPPAKRKARIKELLTGMGLWERRGERVSNWSRGMKQKLALSRALIHSPPLVFLDEPTAGLDVVASTALREDLAALVKREKTTVFLTTHNMAEAERLCSHVGIISHGSLVAVGHPDELRSKATKPHVEIFGSGFGQSVLDLLQRRPEVLTVENQNSHLSIHLRKEVDVAPLVDLLVNAGVQVEEVRKGQASLEETFLTIMEEER